jgi:hypothetical protein
VQAAVEAHITNNLPDPTVGDVIGGRKTIVQESPVLPTGLPHPVVVEGARYGALPAGRPAADDDILVQPGPVRVSE